MRGAKALALALGTLLSAPLALAVPAAQAADGDPAGGKYTVTPLAFTVQAGGRTCTVDADLYRPAGADKDHARPAVLATNGFGGSKSDSTAAIGAAVASRGFVSLVYSGLGFGKSGCLISLDDPQIDGRAASALIDFLAGTRTADDGTRVDYVTQDRAGDPRVGMIGGSYGGAVQMATAAVDHRVDALVPLITWNDLAYSLDPNNVAAPEVPGAFKWQWANGFFLIGEGQPLLEPSLDPSRINSLTCLHFTTGACDTVHTLNSGRYPADRTKAMLEYARGVSPVTYLKHVKAPTLLIQGQADTLFNLNEAEATYRTLRAQSTPTAMIWQSWGHSGGMSDPAPGELDLAKGNLEESYTGRRILSWFDRYLLHNKSADTGPRFAYYRDWISDPRSTYGTADSVPARSTRFYLSGDGTLVDRKSKVTQGSRSYTNLPVATSHSESSIAGLLGLPDPQPFDTPGTYLDWSTAPLSAPMDLVGSPQLRLKVDSPAAERTQGDSDATGRLVLFAKLYDVAPDGGKTLVHRLVAPVRVPDVTRPFTVKLPGIVHRYEAGHKLRLVVAASDTAYFGNKGMKRVTVTNSPSDKGDSGVLSLPVVR
ncbi:CocE/NonD family hydrolase [Streptomyces sp. NPDC058045]|uniref:CocE/NonD family hydrolase n=1 Tax=Streptomyces sp. NPDC058045 TaxID=3346311 RepID=UPI0036E9A085